MADELGNRHCRLLWRCMELRAPAGNIRRVFDAVSRHATSNPPRRSLSKPAASWSVSLAHHGPDPISTGFEGDHSGARVAERSEWQEALFTASGRHQFHRALISSGTTCIVSGYA